MGAEGGMRKPGLSLTKKKVPAWYQCAICGARGCKLYRPYNAYPSDGLRCLRCHAAKSGVAVPQGAPDSFSWWAGAVPSSAKPRSFWGFSAVPQGGVDWWRSLRDRSLGKKTRVRRLK